MNTRLSKLTRLLAIFSALILIAVIFLPIWRIELDAPQYPEGLVLKIFANRLAGDVEVISGLNHYIGMRPLHTEDFIEFTVLPYIIGALSLFGIVAFLVNRRWFFLTWAGFFILFGIISMIDFYRWNYNYGHNLDPKAPIQVPGMSYQPPIIGFKQLLNFGAYSIPDLGGWIFILVGVLLLAGSLMEIRDYRKSESARSLNSLTLPIVAMLFFASCNNGPRAIKVGVDGCHFCKMTVSDKKFGAELVTDKGKVFVFDDIHCIGAYLQQDSAVLQGADIYITDFENGNLLHKEDVILWESESFKSPMGSNVAAFSNQASLGKFKESFPGKEVSWEEAVGK